MCRQTCRAKSSPEEVISADENLLIYSKPVRLYSILHLRSLGNPSFIPRCLTYKIRARRQRKSASTGMVVFNYKDCNKTLQKTEVRENCSCPFCHMLCGSFKGLQHHLKSFHDLFEFEFLLSEEYQTVNVCVKLDAFGFEEEGSIEDKFEPFSFCPKPRKHTQRGRGMRAKRPNVRYLPMDSPSLANGTALLGKRSLGYPEAKDLAGKFGLTSNTPPAIAHSSLGSDPNAMLTSQAAGPAAKTRKLSAERSEARSHLLLQKRQFFHSHSNQPMSIEEVLSDRDSEDEVDDDVASFEDRQMLDDFVDVTKDEKRFMHLWNMFVRKQRILADGHIPWACQAFSTVHKKELNHCPQLVWCWRVFMVKLWNTGLLNAATMNKCNIILEERDDDSDNTKNNNSVDHRIDVNTNDMDIDKCKDENNSKDK